MGKIIKPAAGRAATPAQVESASADYSPAVVHRPIE